MIFENDLSPFLFHFEVGGIDWGIRWYGLAYLAGFVIAYVALRSAVRHERLPKLKMKDLDTLMTYLILGVIVGGRFGFVVQNLDLVLKDPFFPFKIWEGGMAFFGGLLGVVVASWLFCRSRSVRWLKLADELTVPAAIALGLGRIANFVNGELWGRPTGADWGVIYPDVDRVPRHPSELYEAASHFLLALLLFGAARLLPDWRAARAGRMAALFLTGYGALRFVTEYFRAEPFELGPFTRGQGASALIALIGLAALWSLRRPEPTETNV